MATYAATTRYLFSLHARGMKFGLGTTRALLARLGHPERTFPAVHVAGTNGKGSTSAFLAAMLAAGGLRTGLYTSPHLLHFTERIRVNGRAIAELEVVEVTALLRPLIEELHATFFEVTTAIAFHHFALRRVDVAVVETGLGGRLDSTNVLLPRVCVITTIGLDHTEILGPTPAAIAREKGGIIKPGVPCVTGDLPPEALRVVTAVARRKGAPLCSFTRVGAAFHGAGSDGRERLTFLAARRRIGPVRIGLAGRHQADNARLAVAAWSLLRLRPALDADTWKTVAAAEKGLARVRRMTGIRGRFETLRAERRYIFDVGHNPEGIATLASAFGGRQGGNAVVVLGVMKEKDVRAMLAALRPICRTLIAVRPRTGRALAAAGILRAARTLGIPAVSGGGVAAGLAKARRITRRGEAVIVTGSHYVVGEALAALDILPHGAYIS